MSKVGLKRASELTGKNQSTIHRAMKDGRLSFERIDTGERLIDVSELERVFGLRDQQADARKLAPDLASKDVQLAELRAQLTAEREKSAILAADKEDLRIERDRLLKVVESQTEHIKLLTDQRRPASRWRRWFGPRV